MLAVTLGMLFCVGLALVVLVVVAVPAHRSGREVLTERGEEVARSLRRRGAAGAHGATPDEEPLAAGSGTGRG